MRRITCSISGIATRRTSCRPRLLTKYEASGNAKALALIKKMSPAAWRHIHLNGHYTFHGDGQVIDLDAIVAGLELG